MKMKLMVEPLLSVLLIVGAQSGCAADHRAAPDVESELVGRLVTQRIVGIAGGDLSASWGRGYRAELKFPEHALVNDELVTILQAEDVTPYAGLVEASVLDFRPSKLRFARLVPIVFTCDQADIPGEVPLSTLRVRKKVGERWETIAGGIVDIGRCEIRAQLGELGRYGLVGQLRATSSASGELDGSSRGDATAGDGGIDSEDLGSQDADSGADGGCRVESPEAFCGRTNNRSGCSVEYVVDSCGKRHPVACTTCPRGSICDGLSGTCLVQHDCRDFTDGKDGSSCSNRKSPAFPGGIPGVYLRCGCLPPGTCLVGRDPVDGDGLGTCCTNANRCGGPGGPCTVVDTCTGRPVDCCADLSVCDAKTKRCKLS